MAKPRRRKLIAMGGQPELRLDFMSDNGNVILDVRGLDHGPARDGVKINLLAGVVDNGLFAARRADVLLVERLACAPDDSLSCLRLVLQEPANSFAKHYMKASCGSRHDDGQPAP